MTDDDDEVLAAFGYQPHSHLALRVAGVQVADGMDADTLEPAVMIYLRPGLNAEQTAFALPVDLAEQLARQVLDAAHEARARSLHPPA